ncbi:hypothetical protein Q9L58_001002 [Maublancomyces gigas]|uniref:Uncharacterized protein n=1 Tax=Discina gigas TaxID=1032678 RepID=A0ABR3GWE2_9PEZI
MPSDTSRARATACGLKIAPKNHPGACDSTLNVDCKNTIDVPIRRGRGRPVTKNRPTTRSSTTKSPPFGTIDTPEDQTLIIPDSQQVVDIGDFQDYSPILPNNPSYAAGSEEITSTYMYSSTPSPPPLELPDLEIVFNSQHRTVNVDDEVAYFNSIYPPSLEIFLVMLQLRHDMLEEEDIDGIYVGGDSGQQKRFGSLLGKAEVWDITMDIMFKTAISVKIYVEARNPTKTYCIFITRNIG